MSFPTNVLSVVLDPIQDPTLYLAILSTWSPPICEFLSLSLFFITLTVLKNTDQVFYRMTLSFGLSDVFLIIGFLGIKQER